MAKCLHQLTEKGREFSWTDENQEAFGKLKEKLTHAPILCHPDFSNTFILDTDASNKAIGGVLSQVINGEERVIAYASRTLSKTERRYCVTRKELPVVVQFIKHFRHFLYGRQFLIRIHHSSLQWLRRFKNPEGQLVLWLEVISSYNMVIKHRPRVQHRNADALSRIPCHQCGFVENWETTPEIVKTINIQDSENDGLGFNIRKLQKEDLDLKTVLQWVNAGSKPSYSSMGKYSYVVKSLWSQWRLLSVQDGVLFRENMDTNSK